MTPQPERSTTDTDEGTRVQSEPPKTTDFSNDSTNPTFGSQVLAGGVPEYPFLSPPLAADEIGRLGDYRILKKLGEGGMGFVFRGEDPGLKRFIALKVMRPEVAKKPQAAERFLREGRAAAGLKSDHIITIYQVGQANGVPFLAMEFLEGLPLDEWIKGQKKAVQLPQVLRVVRDTLRGLATAHDKGLIHRDIKPANLWLEKGTSRIKLLDFGLTRGNDADAQLTQEGAVVGTPAYMAPEQASGKPVDPRADLFSIGVVMYQLLAGKNPFARGNLMETLGAIGFETQPPVSSVRPDVPKEYSDFLDRLLAKDANARPAHAKGALLELAAIEKKLANGNRTAAVSGVGVPLVAVPLPQAAPQVWDALTEDDGIQVRTARVEKTRSSPDTGNDTPRKPPANKKLLLGGGLFAFLVVLGGIIIIITNKDGTKTKVEVPDDGTKVEVQQGGKTVASVGGKKAPPAKVTMDADRRAAEFVLRGGGSVGIGELAVAKIDQLPKEPFRVTTLSQSGHATAAPATDADLELFRPLKDLSRLTVNGPISDAGLATIAAFPRAAELVALSINNGKITDAGLKVMPKFERVTDLGLLGNADITGTGLVHLKGLPIRTLNLGNSGVRDANLAALEHLPALVTLSIFTTGITEEGLKHVGKVRTLEHLAIQFSKSVSDAGLVHLAGLEKLANLECNGINGDRPHTAAGIAAIANLKALKYLHLGVIPTDAATVEKLNGLALLERLRLSVPGDLDDAGLARLARLKAIQELNVAKTKVTAGGVKAFRAALPECKVASDFDADADPKPDVPGTYTNALGMKFVPVPKGTGWLGGGGGKPGETKVEFTEDFYLGKYEVTQGEWEGVMGANPSHFSRTGAGKNAVKEIPDADLKRFPVESVSWDDCQLFIKKLNEREKEAGWVYRLPTEAEWEYACRGGPVDPAESAFDFYFAKPTNTLAADKANFNNVLKRTCQVGSYEPNLLGLHDMHGNVHEWCDDAEKSADGASDRVRRGGFWSNGAGGCRAASRSTNPPSFRDQYLGLRLARVPNKPNIKAAADPDRRAAEYILKGGGFVRIGSEQFRDIAKLPKEPFKVVELEQVTPREDFINDEGLELFRPLTELQSLVLAAPITEDGLAKLGTFPAAQRLTKLYVGGSGITDDGLKIANRFKDLQELGLLGAKNVTGGGLAHLKGSKLKLIDLAGTATTDASLQHLKALPNLLALRVPFTPITDAGLKTIGELTQLDMLNVRHCENITDEGMKHLRNLDKLGYLSYGEKSHDKLTGASLESVGQMKNLKFLFATQHPLVGIDVGVDHLLGLALLTLDLNGTELSDRGLAKLTKLKSLKGLNVRGSKVTGDGVKAFRAALSACKVESDFDVAADPDRAAAEWVIGRGGHVFIGDARYDEVAKLPKEPFKLTYIAAVKTPVLDADLDRFGGLTDLTALFVHGPVTDAGLKKLAASPLAKQLVSLSMQGGQMTDGGLTELARFSPLKRFVCEEAKGITGTGFAKLKGKTAIDFLILTHSGLTDDGLAAIRDAFPDLNYLSILGTEVTDEGMKHVGAMKLTGTLQMQYCRSVTDAGMRHLEKLTDMVHLEYGFETKLTGEAFKSVGKMKALKGLNAEATFVDADVLPLLGLENLSRLGLTSTSLTDVGLATLAKIKGLKELNLQGTKVTAEGVKKFKAAVPECKVASDFDK